MPSTPKKDIRSLKEEQLIALFAEISEPKFRAKQVHQWLWQKAVSSFDQMTNLPKALREKLNDQFEIREIEIADEQISEDGTIKFGFKVFDGEFIEGVLIPKGDRMTACISSQVGCSLTCKFCATASLDRKRNLDFFEIFDQVVIIDRKAKENYGKPLTNIVYMGMGEPLLNYANVKKSIEHISSPDGLGMSPKRITLSTVGISKMIKKMADDDLRINLAVSLHAPTNAKRGQIMPINDSNDIEGVIEALEYWYAKTGNRITHEYVMLSHFNETDEDAAEMAKICERVPSKVNLIEYNPIDNALYNRSSGNRAMNFKRELERHGVIANIRRSRGKDIDAACGQLANKQS
ncbi:MAG: 23S rRNA (adenine(2503)-C(2))-methyltransferase RlmN [Bacteroidia bacterium]